jgi:hypothetical protein
VEWARTEICTAELKQASKLRKKTVVGAVARV